MRENQTYKQLRNMIYQGRLRPGQRLREVDLSRVLSISRIPLRECLVRLESEGLVRRVPNSATFVEDFCPVDFLEMYSMRLALEPLAARLAAVDASPRLVARLQRLCEQMTQHTKAENWAKLDRADYQFHYTILKASQHHRLIRSYENCHIEITGFRAGYAHLKTSAPNATAREHLRIIEALEQRDPERAEKASYDHVYESLRVIEKHLGIRLQDLSKLRTAKLSDNGGEQSSASGKNARRAGADRWTAL